MLIKFNENKAEIEVKYQKKDREGKVKIIIENRKELYLNDIKMKKLSDILGNIYVVIFSPENINILNEILNRDLNILKCPLDEIGSGSVNPCIIPRIKYFNINIFFTSL